MCNSNGYSQKIQMLTTKQIYDLSCFVQGENLLQLRLVPVGSNTCQWTGVCLLPFDTLCSSHPLDRAPLLALPLLGSGQTLGLGASAVFLWHLVRPRLLCGPPHTGFVAEGTRIDWSCSDLSSAIIVLGGNALVSIYLQSQAHLSADDQHWFPVDQKIHRTKCTANGRRVFRKTEG